MPLDPWSPRTWVAPSERAAFADLPHPWPHTVVPCGGDGLRGLHIVLGIGSQALYMLGKNLGLSGIL